MTTTDNAKAPNVPAIDWLCFSYLTAERGAVYRAVIDVFAAAKAEFSLHLRPTEVQAALARGGVMLELADIEAALQQLEGWGNLQSYQDNADVASLVDYYRKRLLYQLSAHGEAAHASTLTFVERLQQQAKLDARALERIAEGTGQLVRLALELRNAAVPSDEVEPDAAAGHIDPVVTLTTLRSLCQDADELTSRAQSFFRWLHEQTESDQADLEAFLSYKEQLIDYLQQFVSELITRGSEIARRLDRPSESEYRRLAKIAATEEVGQPRAGEEASHAARIDEATRRWESRLAGLRGWFKRRGQRPSQSDQLRAAARAAIPRLLQLASQMNDRQSGRTDRVADLRTLACHFLRCRDDAEAHELFRAAFALSPSRHWRVDQRTLELQDQLPVSPHTRWLDAEPIEFTPQLRATGRQPAASSNRRVVDRSAERSAAKRRLSLEAGRDDSSRETLIALGKCKLSDIGKLDRDAFRLLLELIELAAPKHRANNNGRVSIRSYEIDSSSDLQAEFEPADLAQGSARAISRDGTLQIVSGEAPGDCRDRADGPAGSVWYGVGQAGRLPYEMALAAIGTEGGELWLADIWIEVTRVG